MLQPYSIAAIIKVSQINRPYTIKPHIYPIVVKMLLKDRKSKYKFNKPTKNFNYGVIWKVLDRRAIPS